MSEIRHEESQGELFPGLSEENRSSDRLSVTHRTQKPILFSTSLEQILLFIIILILSYCGVFFLGVLRGKSLGPDPDASRTHMTPVQAANVQSSPPIQRRAPIAAPIPTRIPQTTVSPAPAQTRPTGTTVLDPSKPYTVQLVTYKSADLANNEVTYWKKRGYDSFVITSGDYYVVCAGQYAGQGEAKNDLTAFRKKFKDSYLRRR